MGLPQILIKFKTAGSTAIRRSARGQVVLLVPGGSRSTVTFSRMDQVEESAVGSTAYELLRLCFLGNPAKVHLAYYLVGAEGAALAGNAKLAEGGWLCAPAMAADTLVAFVKEKRAEGRPLRAVVNTKTAPNNAGIVNFRLS